MISAKEIIGLIDSPSREDILLVESAYEFAEKAHERHERFSGEPYFIHLTETAKILAEYGMSATTIAAGLLHDSIEDTEVTEEMLKEKFCPEILFLIDGVTNLGQLKYRGSDRHNESLRKLFVAMSEDIRVLMIKLADRLHNMRTLFHVPKEKQKRIAADTLEIYAPIAYRLGIRKLSRELEDLAFPYVYPAEAKRLKELTRERYDKNLEGLEKFLKSVKKALAKEGITKDRTEYRVKGLYSLHKKLLIKKKDPDQVFDVLALRIIVPQITDCYQILGIIHGIWRPLPGRIKDYIAFPKPNGYQALQTTVFTGDGSIVEVQIKTEEMHRHAEYGIASHMSYKLGNVAGKGPESLQWIKHLLPKQLSKDTASATSKTFSKNKDVPQWIKEIVEHHNIEDNNKNFARDCEAIFLNTAYLCFLQRETWLTFHEHQPRWILLIQYTPTSAIIWLELK